MRPDPQRVLDTQAWFARADQDMRAAVLDLTAEPPLTEDAAFHAQQLAEKAMKGFLTWHDQIFRRTHDLAEIGALCVAIDPSLDQVCRLAERLTVYAWVFRYPGAPEALSRADAEEALAVARQVHEATLARLPHDVRPEVPRPQRAPPRPDRRCASSGRASSD
jgi:HEPN domain-containing protein